MKRLKFNFLLDLFFPITCLGCHKKNSWLCSRCLAKIKINQADSCPKCKKFSFYAKTHPWCYEEYALDGLIVSASYKNELLDKIIYALKYNFAKELSRPLAKLMIDKIEQLRNKQDQPHWLSLLFDEKLIVLPVPLHGRKYRWRGFNQAELIAQHIALEYKLNVEKNILKRKKNTLPQTELARRQRLKNVAGAFRVKKEWRSKLADKKILLIDDVATTTTTLNECARELKKYNPKEVWALVVARG